MTHWPHLPEIAAAAVLTAWIANNVAAYATGDYRALELITPLMTILAGALFAYGFSRRRNGNGGPA